MVSKKFQVLCVLGLAMGYWLHHPLPDGIAEPWKLRFFLAGVKPMTSVLEGGTSLGLWTKPGLMRMLSSLGNMETYRDPRVETTDVDMAGVPVRIYRPKGSGDTRLPAVVYFHGGGWVFLSVDTYDPVTSYLAAEANVVVISVEYRLAPEHKFPAAAHDCINATAHLIQNAAKYKVDKNRIGVAGDSSGGNLAAAVSQHFGQTGDFQPIKIQALIYPALQSFDFNLPAYLTNSDVNPEIISRRKMVEFWLWYYQGSLEDIDKIMNHEHMSNDLVSRFSRYVNVGNLPQKYQSQSQPKRETKIDPVLAEKFQGFLSNELANPLMAKSLDHSPASFVLTAEYDVLRDDGLLYVHSLKEAGIHVTHHHFEGGYHGFLSFLSTPIEPAITRQAVVDLVNFLRSQGF